MTISKLFRNVGDRVNQAQWRVAAAVASSGLWLAAEAALPVATAPSTTATGGDWLGMAEGYAKDTGLIVGLAISTASLLWVAWMGIAKFNEVRNGKAEFGELGLVGISGAGLLLFIGFLLTEAGGVF